MIGLSVYLTVALVFGCFANYYRSFRLKKIYLFLVFCIACLYTSLRGASVGIDTYNYLQYFDQVIGSSLTSLPNDKEIGYTIINYLLSFLSNNRQIILVFEGVFISFSFYTLIKRYSKDVMLSSIIFISSIFTVSLNVSRQYLAIAVFCYAIPCIVDKRLIKSIVLLIVATTIHNSAIVFAPLLLFAVPRFKLNFKSFSFVTAISILMVPLYSVVINVFTSIFTEYARFFSSERYSAESEISSRIVLLFLLVLCLGVACVSPITISKGVIKRKNRTNSVILWMENEKELVELLLFFLLFVEYVVSYFISRQLWIASRITYFFQISMMIFIPNVLYYLKKDGTFRSFVRVMYLLFIVYFMWFGFKYFQSDPHGVLPYMFFYD